MGALNSKLVICIFSVTYTTKPITVISMLLAVSNMNTDNLYGITNTVTSPYSS